MKPFRTHSYSVSSDTSLYSVGRDEYCDNRNNDVLRIYDCRSRSDRYYNNMTVIYR